MGFCVSQTNGMKKVGMTVSSHICILFFLGLMEVLPLSGISPAQDRKGDPLITLTESEQKWLADHPVIRLAPDPEFQPIEFFDSDGRYAGIGADFSELISRKLGIHFAVVRCSSWDEVMARVKNREVDVLNAVIHTPQREEYLLFPPPYIFIPSVIIVQKKVDTRLTLDMLEGMRVVMVSGYGYVDLIRNKHPEITIDLVSDLKAALRKVSFGMADAFVGDLATASFYIESEGITNLKLAGEAQPANISGFAVRSDWPELCRILEKGVSMLSEEERGAVLKKWIHLAVDPGLTRRELKKIFGLIFGGVILVVIGFVAWNHQLRRRVNLKTKDLSMEIQERQRTQEALKEKEAHLRTLLKTIPDMVWLKDPDGIYLSCNSKFEQFFGATEEEIVGRSDFDYCTVEQAEFFRRHDQAAIEKGAPIQNEEEVTFAVDGHHEILETIKTPMFGVDGHLVGVLGISRNITDRKQAEAERIRMEEQLRQAHKMEAIGTLAGGVAHDFNNILAAIIGYADMAAERLPKDTLVRYQIDKILQAGIRAKELVRHILYFSRKEALKPMPIQIHQVVFDALELLRASIPSTIEFQIAIDSHCGHILADPIQIHQVMMNLCTNSAQAMEEKGGTLTVGLTSVLLGADDLMDDPALKPGAFLQLTVADTGVGIDPKHLHRVFDPYFTTKDVGKGSGMGLAVVHGIVKSHGGLIKLGSDPGKGTRVDVFFPLINSPKHDYREEFSPLPKGSETILVVDDEESIVDIFRQRLELLGYQVCGVTSSLEALDLFRSKPDAFAAVITDQTMPRMTGEELARELLLIRPGVRILICTGFSSRLDEEKVNDMGISALIMKPADFKELAIRLRTILDQRSPESGLS